MIITWTIATIAALIGSSLISSTSEETEQSKKHLQNHKIRKMIISYQRFQ